MKKVFLSAVLTALLLCGAVLAHASSAGMVLTVNPGAWALRDGKKVTLAVKSEVFKGDELVTDATGRVQVIFADDTTISLGADTTVAVSDFVFDAPGGKASFSANMAKGMARFVTGKVVEKNRSGFSVTTPQATVGIRGTTFAVNISPKGVTSVIGLDVKSAFPIAVTNKTTGAVAEIKTSGMAVDAAPSGNTSYQTPPGQFSQSSSSVNGKPAAVASASGNGESGQDSGQSAGQTGGQTATPATAPVAASSEPAPTPVAAASSEAASTPTAAVSAAPPATGSLYAPELSGDAQALSNSAGKSSEETLTEIADSGSSLVPPVITPPPGPALSASWSGTLHNGHTNTSGIVGAFSFDTSLTAGSGTLTNATMNITSGNASGLVANQSSGAGISGGNFNVNLTVTTPSNNGHFILGGAGSMAGTISSGGTGSNVAGTWNVRDQWGGDIYNGGHMHFEGSKTP